MAGTQEDAVLLMTEPIKHVNMKPKEDRFQLPITCAFDQNTCTTSK